MSDKPNFETARTRYLRSLELDEQEDRTICHIEQFGCSIFHIGVTNDRPKWSYTLGVFDTCGQPEILQIGLKESAAHALLNSASKSLHSGVDLAQGRHRDLLGEVECEFRPVDPKWIKHLMGWAVWYYGGTDFPILQAIYPDIENRFPEDEGFNEYFRQPMLQPDVPWTRVEEDFWASADPKSSLFNWKFPDEPHTGVFLSNTVHTGAEAVTYVSHDIEEGAWQFLSDSMDAGGGPVISCFHHPIDNDPTLVELADLPLGWCAVREKPGAPWKRSEKEPEEEETMPEA
jgi:Domain of unknown function (DUF4262)